MSAYRYRNVPLAIGALLGALLAAIGLVRVPTEPAIEKDAVAMVNGHPIRRADYDTALSGLASSMRDKELDAELKRHVLDRLIDEELLIQAALSLGLAERDRRVRADLSSAAIGFIVNAPSETEPTEEALRSFFEERKALFASDAQIQAEQVYLAAGDHEELASVESRARELGARWLRGEPVTGDAAPLPLPRTPLSIHKLEQYVGPSNARMIASLPPGSISEPVAGSGGYSLFRTVSKSGGTTPVFEDVRDQVRAAFERHEGDLRLRRFLREERERATVSIAPDFGK